jgi:hypothetical protein
MDVLDGDLPRIQSAVDNERYLLAYFGKQSGYYLRCYQSFQSGHRFTFNIGAFFGGLFWVMYRKLFRQVLIMIAVIFVIALVEEFLYVRLKLNGSAEQATTLVINFVVWMALSFGGNYLYIQQTDKNLNAILNATPDEEKRMLLLRKKGGVSSFPFYLIGFFILIFLISFLI